MSLPIPCRSPENKFDFGIRDNFANQGSSVPTAANIGDWACPALTNKTGSSGFHLSVQSTSASSAQSTSKPSSSKSSARQSAQGTNSSSAQSTSESSSTESKPVASKKSVVSTWREKAERWRSAALKRRKAAVEKEAARRYAILKKLFEHRKWSNFASRITKGSSTPYQTKSGNNAELDQSVGSSKRLNLISSSKFYVSTSREFAMEIYPVYEIKGNSISSCKKTALSLCYAACCDSVYENSIFCLSQGNVCY